MSLNRRFVSLAAVAAAGALALSACAANETQSQPAAQGGNGGEQLSGQLKGQGSSAQKVAQDTWIKNFQTANPGVTINYSPDGSGAGRDGFKGGGVDFAGSDRAFKPEENTAGAFGKCEASSKALDIPVYVSPIAISFNVEGVQDLNLDAATTAGIFKGTIAKWNDPAIVALNPGVQLPDAAIVPVHRSDNSGTTENFTDWLNKAAGDVWTDKASGDWPASLKGEAAKGTAGVVAAVKNGKNTIGYVDESQARDLNNAKIGADGNFSEPSAQAAGEALAASPVESGRDANDLAIKIDRKAAGYPVYMVSYALVCQDYKDDKTAQLVKSYIGSITSSEGQQAAAQAAGAAPLPEKLSGQVKTAVDSIK
ncbi:phosphate ABC transporter substrate-binding protein PstS [Enemella evansiae]|uniref:phosphate ABC transporter substrate-binding protein PstS n=1 Tax=Enemella evansiae TaxID=2016499 RepID=UPI001E5228A1|nr:phosphate ABC transporter substrate-binding protein PstS [Enemella evansiae]